MWKWDKWEFKPNGLLKFQIHEREPNGGPKTWTDCTRYKLEEKLGEIVEWMMTTAKAVKIERLRREEQRRKWDEEARLRQEAEYRRQIEDDRRQKLEQNVQQWVLAENTRMFVAKCEEVLAASAVVSRV